MKNRLYRMLLLLVCLTAGYGFASGKQDGPLVFEEFFHEGMEKIPGVLPVYRDSLHMYLEIPESCIGRELEIRAQINKGFDVVARPLKGLGVVYLQKEEEGKLYVQRRIFSERVSDRNSELYEALCKSNRQPIDLIYPVVAYAAGKQGYIIDVTDLLKTGDDWFQVAASKVRDHNSSLAKIMGVHAFPQGVSFTISRMYGYSPDRLLDNIVPPRGYLPLEVGCVVTLLPEKEMNMRLADKRFGYHAIQFMDYSQNPYSAMKDSVVHRWNLGVAGAMQGDYRRGKLVVPANPLVFYIDTCCPKEWVPCIKEGVLAWNKAFEHAGFKDALRVKMADASVVLAEQKAVIAYDLDESGVKSAYTFHPKTGEILSCRINIGHGFLPKELWSYFLECGAVDGRIRKDREHPVIAGEILRSKVTSAVGKVLGLKENPRGSMMFSARQVKDAAWLKKQGYTASVVGDNPYNYAVQPSDHVPVSELMPRVGRYDCLAIEWGYREFPGHENMYETDEMLRKRFLHLAEEEAFPGRQVAVLGVLSSEPLKTLVCGLDNLLGLKDKLEEIVCKGRLNESAWAISEANRKVIEKYSDYLVKIASLVGSEKEQHEILDLLDKYLFSGEKDLVTPLAKGHFWDMKETYVRQVADVYRKLFHVDLVKRWLESDAVHTEHSYTLEMYWNDLFSRLFCDFSAGSEVSYSRMDMQALAVNTLLEQFVSAYPAVMQGLLQELRDRLQELSVKHREEVVRNMYAVLVVRIDNKLNELK